MNNCCNNWEKIIKNGRKRVIMFGINFFHSFSFNEGLSWNYEKRKMFIFKHTGVFTKYFGNMF